MTLVQRILGGGKVKSSQARRVVKWAQEHGYPIDREESAEETFAKLEAEEAARAAARQGQR